MAVALKVNGVACRDIDTRNGVEKLSIETYPGGATTSPAPIFYFTYEDHDTAIEDYSESGTDHDGTGTGTERSDTAKLGAKSLEFGTSDFVQLSHHSQLDQDHDDAWSFSTWFKTDASGYRGLYIKREGAAGYKGNAVFIADGVVQGYVTSNWATGNGASIFKISGDGFDDEGWYHLTMTYDGSGAAAGLLLYIDGALETFTVSGGRASCTAAMTNTVNPKVGGDTTTTAYGMGGLMDETAFWNTALTANQVTVLYNGGSPASIAVGL